MSTPVAWVPRVLLILSLLLIVASSFGILVSPSADDDFKNTVRTFAKEIERAQFHKLYVSDFLDPSGFRTDKGCFFASTFSTNLAKNSHMFEVINRIQAQKQLDELHISAQDLQQPEILSRAAKALGADAVLVGSASISTTDASLFLALREAASGKEVHSMEFHEHLQSTFESSFPAAKDESGHVYYFPGLDGVLQPKCIYCPDPEYTDEERRNKIQGKVLMSVAIDEKGKITDVRVIKTPWQDLAKQSVNILKKWRMEPSHDVAGNAVPVRVIIEVGFRLLN